MMQQKQFYFALRRAWGPITLLLSSALIAVLVWLNKAFVEEHLTWVFSLGSFAALYGFGQIVAVSAGNSFRSAWQSYDHVAFVRLFGSELVDSEYLLSLPSFEIAEQARTALKDVGLTTSLQYFRPLGVDGQFKSGHIREIIASSDMTGLAHVVNALGDHTKRGPRVALHTNLFDHADQSGIAFGLQTNPSTPLFLDRFNVATQSQVLTRGIPPLDAHQNFKSLASAGAIKLLEMYTTPKNAAACFAVTLDDETKLEFNALDDRPFNLGVILIVRGDRSRNVRHVLCAGVGPGGTSGASRLLARQWEEIASSVDEDFDVLAIFTATRLVRDPDPVPGLDGNRPQDAGTVELIRMTSKRSHGSAVR
ncbi:MAG: hypothetical protein R3C27_00875 [Hyphomonadaceae bacterium]